VPRRAAAGRAALGTAVAWSGDFTAAAALISEADAIGAATGSRTAPFAALTLACLRGDQAEAAPLIEATIGSGMAGGHGMALAYAHWSAAILANGLGRYGEALAAARHAAEDMSALYISMWALPELIEAAVRSGNSRMAGDALARLSEAARAGGTDLGLGIEARSRALLSEGAPAESLYREAVDRLGRTQLRPEAARAHLLYGEWLRRENRRVDARVQLRTAHELLSALGMQAFAERARRELRATGEKVPQAHRRDRQPAYPPGGLHRPAGLRWVDQRRNRRAAVPVRPHDRMAPAQGIRQARHQLPPGPAPGPGRCRPGRLAFRRPGRPVS
jgi:hypothetical protein